MNYTNWYIIKDSERRFHIMSGGKDGSMSINVAKMPVHPDAEANAQHIVDMHNKWDAFEAMYEALKESTNILILVLGLMFTPEGKKAVQDMININQKALSLAKGK